MQQPDVHAPDALTAIEQYFDKGWTDGLPIVPPTEERVAEFLATVDRDPAEVLIEFPENNRSCSVLMAAVNAVMAGCRPEYFPVVVAAIEGCADPMWADGKPGAFFGSLASTGSSAQLLVVNGKIRNDLAMNSSVNVFGPGTRANSTIGRSIRLIIINALGMMPSVLDMAAQGNPAKYSLCLAEAEEESPWDPLNTEHGYKSGDNTVSVFGVRSPVPLESRWTQDPEVILGWMADLMSVKCNAYLQCMGPTMIAMGVEHAKLIAAKGWSKNDVKQFLWDNAKLRVSELDAGARPEDPGPQMLIQNIAGVEIREYAGESWLHMCRSPEDMVIIVSGAPNAGVSAVMTPWGYMPPKGKILVKPIDTKR